ncbi:multiple sugar transport system substrate-binding protein [Friedmanniella endophytica]|uniref:Multiple sugar transport system substrate-binding protein n=1 Tax=Microlunatus kandeliicorticis TaxID=1759536 RepID=A0A7W3ITN5_9ACTN|nr:sugar ABC transporter substrate-binding protein [Microlunatus kandeliicorticis]MBA8795019.1 multiple sugar transport system substrate-binding protein [Microlunatus kandeliicorticis]
MIRRVRTSVLAALSASVLIGAAACGSSGSDPGAAGSSAPAFNPQASGSLRAWGFNNADDVGTSRLTYAKGQLGGVTVTLDQTDFDAQKFVTRVASGNVPDVVQMGAQSVASYAAQGLIQPLDGCFSAHQVDPAKTYYGSVRDDVTYQGKIWGVPQFYQPPAIILNERVIKQAGLTDADFDTSKPDQLVATAKKLYQQKGGNPSRLGFDPVASGQPGLWILGYGGKLADDQGKPTLDDPSNVKGIEVLKQLEDAQGGYAKIKSFSDAFDTFGAGNQFVKDQVAAQVDAQWYVNVLAPYVDKVQIGAVPFRGSDGQPFTVASGQAFVIPTAAKNKDAACAWALALTGLDAWKAAGAARAQTLTKTPGAINTGLFTGQPQADQQLRSQYVKKSGNAGFDQTISTYYDIVGSGKSFGASPVGAQIQSELTNAIEAALRGDKTPQQALADGQAAALRAYDQLPKK